MLRCRVNRRVGAAVSEIIHARVARDAEQPGVEAALVAPRRAVLEHPHEHVLHQVLRRSGVAGHAHEKVEQRAVVPLEEDSELADVSVAYRVHECLVGHSSVVSRKLRHSEKVTLGLPAEVACLLPEPVRMRLFRAIFVAALCTACGSHPTAPSNPTNPTDSGPRTSDPGVGVVLTDDFGGRQLFPPDNWWNQNITTAPLDAQSDAYINFIGRTRTAHPDFDPPPYGIPYVGVGGSQPRV